VLCLVCGCFEFFSYLLGFGCGGGGFVMCGCFDNCVCVLVM